VKHAPVAESPKVGVPMFDVDGELSEAGRSVHFALSFAYYATTDDGNPFTVQERFDEAEDRAHRLIVTNHPEAQKAARDYAKMQHRPSGVAVAAPRTRRLHVRSRRRRSTHTRRARASGRSSSDSDPPPALTLGAR
jgi:hypothetical protein